MLVMLSQWLPVRQCWLTGYTYIDWLYEDVNRPWVYFQLSLVTGGVEWHFRLSNFQVDFGDWWLRYISWQVIVIGHHLAPSHYLCQCWIRSAMLYCVIGPYHNKFTTPWARSWLTRNGGTRRWFVDWTMLTILFCVPIHVNMDSFVYFVKIIFCCYGYFITQFNNLLYSHYFSVLMRECRILGQIKCT